MKGRRFPCQPGLSGHFGRSGGAKVLSPGGPAPRSSLPGKSEGGQDPVSPVRLVYVRGIKVCDLSSRSQAVEMGIKILGLGAEEIVWR